MKNLPPTKTPMAVFATLLSISILISGISWFTPILQGEENTERMVIETPEFIPIRDPFMIHITLNLSGDYRIKASLNSIQGKYASRFWNGTDWVYPGTEWLKMPIVPGNFSGFLYLMPYPDYSGWKQLVGRDTAFVNLTVQALNSSEQKKTSVEVRLMDYGESAGVHGHFITGRVYLQNSSLEGGVVCLRDRENPAGNHTFFGFTAFYTTEENGITGDGTGKGYYHLWAPSGNYTLYVFQSTAMNQVVYAKNFTLSSNLTYTIGNYTPPHGVVFNEVLYDPQGDEVEEEFVEIFNSAGITINLTGWSISDRDGDGEDFVFPICVLPPGGFVVLHAGDGDDCNIAQAQHFYMGKSSPFLSNTGDDLVLSDSEGTPVDYVAWGTGSGVDPPPDGLEWSGVMTAEEGYSLSLIPDGEDMNSSANWRECIPTPGEPNILMGEERYIPFLSPDSALEALRSTIEDAEEEIEIEAYSVSNYMLVEEVEKALDRGVRVRALLRAEHPIGAFDGYTLYAAARWSERGAEVRENSEMGEGSLMLVDSKIGVFFTSNWSLMTLNLHKNYGKRAWGIIFENSTTVRELKERFETEWNESMPFPIQGNGSQPGDFGNGDYPAPFSDLISFTNGGIKPIYFIEDKEWLISLLERAKKEVYIETDRLVGNPQFSGQLLNLSKAGIAVKVLLSGYGGGLDISLLEDLVSSGAQVRVNTEFGLNTLTAGMDGILIIVDDKAFLLPGLVSDSSHSLLGLEVTGAPLSRMIAFFERDFQNSTDYQFVFTPYHPMFTEVYYNTYGGGDDEYLCIYNQANTTVNLGGWTLTDGEGVYTIPSLTLSSGEKAYFAKNTTIFFHLTGIHTSLTFPLSLGNERDSITLLNPAGSTVDAVAWGGETIDNIWNGVLLSVGKGQVIRRNRENGLYVDTNDARDWEHIRIYMVGQSDFPYQSFRFNGSVTLFVSPDSIFEAIHNELLRAKRSIYLNVYEFTNYRLMEDLLSALNRSVKVSVFLEGGPVGGVPDEELYIARMLYEAGATVRFLNNNNTVGEPWLSSYIHDRYNYDHAKYAVIDGTTLILTSENWKETGIPVDPRYGNRGWGIIVRNSEVAKYFERVFQNDSSPVFYDVADYGEGPYISTEIHRPEYYLPVGNYRAVFPVRTVSGEFEITPILSPDHTLREDAILGMINSAKKSVYIEQLQCYRDWGEGLPNLYLEAAIQAAMRGCEVRILLDSRYVNTADNKLDNADTVNYINARAKTLELDNLEARLVILRGLSKVHNKGVIVDGNITLISSINWGKGGVLLNREAGVIVRNQEVADYYTEVFLYDWSLSESKDGVENQEVKPSYLISAFAIIGGVVLGIIIRWKRR